jgi:hypothetical protein
MAMTDQSTDIELLGASLVSAKEEIEAAKDALDDAKRAYGKLEAQVAEAMETAGQTLLKAGGVSLVCAPRADGRFPRTARTP